MDKKTLKALNNFALALEELVETFANKAEEEKEFGGLGGIFSGQEDINNTLVRISDKIDNIESSNKAMIKNQEKILKMTKDIKSDNDSNNLFSFGNNKKSKKGIKDGVSTILLIAGGVLAIGFAFKLIGDVDFLSVIALSIALPLIATAFVLSAVVIKEYGLTIKDILMSAGALISMSIALTISSWILRTISIVDTKQVITAIGIAAAFAVVANSIAIMALSIGDIKPKDLIMLPLVLLTLSAAITISSWILSSIQPVGLMQTLTAIGISVVFVIISYAIAKLTENIKGIKAKDLIILPFMLATMSMAIVASSIILGYTQPISLDLLLNIALQSLALGIIGIALSIPMYIISKSGLSIGGAFEASLILVIIAGALMVSSLLINLGTYDKFPSVDWALGTGLALMLFTVPVVALGFIAMSGIGLGALILGAFSSIILATTIVGVSHVIAEGNYDTNGNILSWATGVSLLFLTFTPLMIVLGALKGLTSLLSLGLAPDPIESGKIMMVKIGETIRDVSFVLSDGNYTGGPSKEWAEGVGLAIGAFAPVFATLQTANILSLFGGSEFSSDDYANTIITISESIITAADVFRKAPSNWGGHPTKKWAEGVGLAIGAFAPIFQILNDNGVLDAIFGTTVKPEDMSNAIRMIAGSIREAADLFAGDTGSYTGGPNKKWAEGVGGAISAFASVYALVDDGLSLLEALEGNLIIYTIASSIIGVNNILSVNANNWTGYPDTKWSEGVKSAILGFGEIYDWINSGVFSSYDVDDINSGNLVINKMARGILSVGRILGPLSDVQSPNTNTIKKLGISLLMWGKIIEMSEDMSVFGFIRSSWAIDGLANGAERLTTAINGLNEALGSLQTNQLDALTNISGTLISFSVMDADNFEDIMDIVEDKSETLAELFGNAKNNLDKEQTNSSFQFSDPSSWFGGDNSNIKTDTNKKEEIDKKTLDDVYNMLDAMNGQLSQISTNSSNLSSYVNELRANPEVKIK